MSELPKGWATSTLSNVAALTTGSTPSTKNLEFYGGSIPFAKPGDLDQKAPLVQTEQSLTELGAAQARLLRAGATLVSCIGNLGKVGIAGVPLATNQQINSAEFHSVAVDDRYGYYVCRTLKPWMEREASATTIAILNKGRFGEAEFPLAPLPEQKRIADKLDSTLARVEACRDRLDRIPALLKRFRQSILAAATSGRLTEDWRAYRSQGDGLGNSEYTDSNTCADTPTLGLLPEGWTPSTVGELAHELRYGTSQKCEYQDMGKPVLRIPNIGERGRIDVGDIKRAEFSETEISKLELKLGDLLLIRSNGSVDLVGKCCIVENSAEGYLFAGYLMRLRTDSRLILPWYLYYCFSSPEQRQRIELISKSTSGVNNINSDEVKSLPLLVPPIDEQHEIVRRVETLFAYADRLEARLNRARQQAAQLTPALLAKAFRGELVPQDPADEPAAELLQRLAASRAAAPQPKRGRKAGAATH